MSDKAPPQTGVVPRILPVRQVEKVWGMRALPEPFAGVKADDPVGEIWFEPPAELPELLVKYIFADEKLSIQTHPDDDQAEAAGNGRQGKEECWLVIDAKPGAKLAIDFAEDIGPDAMRAAALDGSIEEKLVWHDVSPGDFFYIPAHTVHAIGGGVSLIEVQQNSDITYRLYDYGRPRELHLDEGIKVASGTPYGAHNHRHLPPSGTVRLVNGPHFTLDRVDGEQLDLASMPAGRCLLIPIRGDYNAGDAHVSAGECALIGDVADIAFDRSGSCLIAAPCA
jgi:mannose-6-phosphate isomerase